MKQRSIITDNVIETKALGKRYKSFWALKDCTITIPRGVISGLVGPNGAGKTTLLKMLAGLSIPTTGTANVLGQVPAQAGEYVSKIGYLAQEIPLYKDMTAEEHLLIGAHVNMQWDMELARKRLASLGIPFNLPVGKLSGGQRAQVALGLALAKKPQLLLLDEPVAALDPLAREDFLASLTHAVNEADGNLTVVMSSHLLGDLERICDHLIVLAAGKTQVCDTVEDVLASHKILTGSSDKSTGSKAYEIVQETHAPRQTTLLVRLHDLKFNDPHWQMSDVNTEEVVLAYMRQERQQRQQVPTRGKKA